MSPTWLLPAAAPYVDQAWVGTEVLAMDQLPLAGLAVGTQHQAGLNASVHLWPQDLAAFVGGRWLVLHGERVRLAPTLSVGAHVGPSPLDDRVTLRAGLAWSVGTRLRWDGSTTLLGLSAWRSAGLERHSPAEALSATEMGLSRDWGEHTARIGLFGPFPTVGYGWHHHPVGVEIRAGGGNGVGLVFARATFQR